MGEEDSIKGENTLDDADSSSTPIKKKEIDIVAIHGLCGFGEKPWISSTNRSWIQDLSAKQKWSGRIIIHHNIADKVTGAVHPHDIITEIASSLLQRLSSIRRVQKHPRPFAFLSHDIGGIIVKKALILAAQDPTHFSDIISQTHFLMFFGCPHRTPNNRREIDKLATQLRLLSGNDSKTSSRCMTSLARCIVDINHSFLQTRMLTRANITNVVSTKTEPVDKIFGQWTTSFGIPLEQVILRDKTHKELIHEVDETSLFGEDVMVTSFPWQTDRLSNFFHAVRFQASPVYPPTSTASEGHNFDWLDKDQTFQAWHQSEGTNLLLLYGTIGYSGASEYAFKKLQQAKKGTKFCSTLYFKFDKFDVRRNSIGAMARTFVVQTLSQISSSLSTIFRDIQPPDFSDCWTDKDAFLFLDRIRRDLGRVGDVIWILDGLDHCDESSHWFISEILSIAELSEQSFKILITTEDDSHIRESLSHFPVIDLTRSTDDLGEEAKLDFLSSLYQERPQFHHVEPALCHLLASCRDDNLLRDLLREWLVISPCHSTIKALEEELESLTPLSATVIFEKALDTVAEGKRPWARNLIMWLLRSARPLSPGELASALTLDHLMDLTFEPSPSTDLMRDAKHCLGPLISVDDGFIRLSHPGGRDVFTSVKPNNHSPWYTLSSPDEDHRTIADLCARHLSLPKVQEEILNACRGSFRANPIFESPLNISSYAIQYWRWHYHQGYPTGNSIPLTLNMTNFLQDEKSLRCWAAANWHFSNLHMRAKSSFITSLPIVASLGFDKLVASTVETPSFKDTVSVSLAITEAARHGHEKVVEVLLRNSSLELSDCLGAMITASRSAEFGVCRVLVGYAIEHFEKIQWPGFLTSRLAYLGPADLLETILQAGADTDVTNPRYPPPIHCAIAGNSHEAVKSLKSHGADLDFINTNWKDTPPLLVAAKFGRVNMIKTLETAAIDKQDKGGATALWTAAITGQHAVMEALLVAGADRTILEVPLTEKDELAMFTMADLSLSKCLDIALKYEVNPNCKVSGRHPSTALGVAAKRGFTSICRTLIDNGAHIQSGDEPLIVYATMSGQQDVVEVFIEQEANLDVMLEIPGFHGSPLIAAAEGGYLDIAKRLIQKGAKCDQRNNKGSTPMCMSAVENHAEMAKLLIDAGADPTLAQDSGWAPIHKCYDLIEPLKVLLDAGVNVDSSSPDGTPLYLAAYHNHLDAVKLILSYKPFVDTRCPEGDFWDTGYTALHMAAYNGSTEMIRMLLEAGADSNIKTPKGASPLIVAAVKKREESIKILLEYNVDLEIVDSFGDTVIHCMKAPTPLPIAKRLINRGANLKFRNKRRQTILDRAVANRDIPFVELLLDMKADINATDGVHGAALHRAVAAGDIEMSKLLISRGADVDLVHDWMHGTSLQAVFEWADSTIDQKDAIARYLLTQTNVDVNIHGGILGSALNSAILHGSLDIIKLLLERGADTRHPDPWGRQPLHLASLRSPEHVRLLLDSESADNVGIANKTVLGQTALHFAVATGNKDLVELILSESQGEISINQPDGDGWTPLLWACRPCDNWGNPNSVKADMIKLLLDHGADPWIQGRTWDDAKWSPLKMARYHGADDDAVQLLLATEKDEDWDEKAHVSKEAARLPLSYCDVCLFGVYGVDYECRDCDILLAFCFKCSRYKEKLHPYHDNWKMKGTMFKEDNDEEEKPESPKVSPDIALVEDDDSEGDWSSD